MRRARGSAYTASYGDIGAFQSTLDDIIAMDATVWQCRLAGIPVRMLGGVSVARSVLGDVKSWTERITLL